MFPKGGWESNALIFFCSWVQERQLEGGVFLSMPLQRSLPGTQDWLATVGREKQPLAHLCHSQSKATFAGAAVCLCHVPVRDRKCVFPVCSLWGAAWPWLREKWGLLPVQPSAKRCAKGGPLLPPLPGGLGSARGEGMGGTAKGWRGSGRGKEPVRCLGWAWRLPMAAAPYLDMCSRWGRWAFSSPSLVKMPTSTMTATTPQMM